MIATEARSSVSRSSCSAAKIAAGSVASATSPTSTEKTALGLVGRSSLLLLVRAANCCGRDRAADQAADRDQREDIGQGLEQKRGLLGVLGQRPREGAREAEEERGAEGAERLPHPEDQRCKRDEASTHGHILPEATDEPDREVRATERGQHAREGDGGVANLVDGDPGRLRGAWMLADRAQPQPR